MDERKKLSEITREEWIALQWLEASQMGDEDRMFIVIGRRTPDEAAQAMSEWDTTEEARAKFR